MNKGIQLKHLMKLSSTIFSLDRETKDQEIIG